MPQPTIQQAFTQAVQHHQAGRFAEAERIYRQILAQQPQHAESLHHLGLLAHQAGRNDIAIDLIRRAIALRPDYAHAYNNLGVALKASGQLDEAIALYRQAIALKPDYADACQNLGGALKDKGNLDEAIAMLRRAIDLNPDLPEAHSNLGIALKDKGQLEQAVIACRQAVVLRPNYADGFNNLGIVLQAAGQLDHAITAWQHAVAINPNLSDAHNNLGNGLKDKGQFDQAIVDFRKAIAINPNLAEAHSNLGSALKELGQIDEAIATNRRAIALKPDFAAAYSNLGGALMDQGRLDEAIAACRQAVAIDPNFIDAHNNLALALLGQGHWLEGWDEYEWRLKGKNFASPELNITQSPWDGRPLDGRPILLRAEQGFGDTLQFIRYLPLVIQRGGKAVVECPPELMRVLQTMTCQFQIVPRGQPLPNFDFCCPLLSLPRAFATTPQTIPLDIPYLFPDAQLMATWREKLKAPVNHFKVGLAWAGNPEFRGDRTRSLSLDRLAAFANVTGTTFFSLQKGNAARQADTPPPGVRLVNLASELHDFADTAAVICQMDLVITTDTSVAHLAGALGRPVWVMVQHIPDWRWKADNQKSLWYPSMRLFRQTSRGDWNSVIIRVVEEIKKLQRA